MAPHERDDLECLDWRSFPEIQLGPLRKECGAWVAKNAIVFDDHLFAPFFLRKLVVNCLSTSGDRFVSGVIGGFVTDRRI